MKIKFNVGDQYSGHIYWKIDEDFSEISNHGYNLNETTAWCIENMNLSLRSKILLSAVAGAVIQHLIDLHIDSNLIFSIGQMYIER